MSLPGDEIEAITSGCQEELINLGVFGLYAGISVWIGTIVSYIPQFRKIIKRKSVEGCASETIALANFALIGNCANML